MFSICLNSNCKKCIKYSWLIIYYKISYSLKKIFWIRSALRTLMASFSLEKKWCSNLKKSVYDFHARPEGSPPSKPQRGLRYKKKKRKRIKGKNGTKEKRNNLGVIKNGGFFKPILTKLIWEKLRKIGYV